VTWFSGLNKSAIPQLFINPKRRIDMKGNDYAAYNMMQSLQNAHIYTSYFEDSDIEVECNEIIAEAMYKIRPLLKEKGLYDKLQSFDEIINTWYDNEKKENERLRERYPFVRVGNEVYWNDPDPKGTSGYYKVSKIRSNEGYWYEDMIILLTDGTSEVEANLSELHEG
jgi:hypothetical protein